MLLAIDIGNSQTSFGIFVESKLTHHWRASTLISRTADEYAALLFPLFQSIGISAKDIHGVAICSVVPPAAQYLELFCQNYLKQTPFQVRSELALGFSLNVEVPKEVGADRLANAAYAVKFFKLPAIVIDLGTATTFDVVSKNRVYEGGIILPGVRMGVDALSSKTSLLPVIDVKFPQSVIGKNTVTCIQSGILYGYCDTLDGLLTRLDEELGEASHKALTGGLASLFHSQLKHRCEMLPNLTLEGIELLYRSAKR